MIPKQLRDKKICIICRKEFYKKSKFSYKQWEKTKACSNKCGYTINGNNRRGLKLPEETKKKMSDSGRLAYSEGRRLVVMTKEYRKKISDGFSREMREKIGLSKLGPQNPMWKGGKTKQNIVLRMSSQYREWRSSVYTRDNYTCQICGTVGGKLNADHIKPFAYYPELRLNIDNGRTLCIDCHKKTPTFGRKIINKYQYA